MVLNTSFNVKGQPIVNTPREAIQTFLGTGIEYLFLENIRLCRPALVPVDLVQATEKVLV
jgi:carbamoyltransferase